MKRIILILLTLLLPALTFAQNPATVTGHAIFPSNGAPTNASVCFTLLNFKPNLPRITGTGVIIQQQNWCITPSTVDGSFSVPIDRNDFITPSGTYWRVDYLWNNIQQSSANFYINSTPFNLDTATPLSQITPVGPNQIITQVFVCPNLVPATTWTCTDNFNDVNVDVQVYNSANSVIYPDAVTVTSPNIITITFVTAQTGIAVIVHAAANISIATNQPNAIISNPIAPQSIVGNFPFSVNGVTLPPNAFSLLNSQANLPPIVGTGSTATVYSYTIPGGAIPNLKGIRLTAGVNHSTGTASVTYAISLNGVQIFNNSASTTGAVNFSATILNTGATTGTQSNSYSFGASSVAANSTLTGLSWGSNQVLALTFNVPATDQVTPIQWLVELIQ